MISGAKSERCARATASMKAHFAGADLRRRHRDVERLSAHRRGVVAKTVARMERSAIRGCLARGQTYPALRGVYHRARIRATRWLHPGYLAFLDSLRGSAQN